MAQVQCPNCGGYRVETKTETIDLKSGQNFDFGWKFWFVLVFFAIAPLFMGTVALLARLSGQSMSFNPSDDNTLICCALPGGLFFTFGMVLYIRSYFKASKVEKYYHTCGLCGYQWSRRADEPLPHVTVRPDLIAKGEERLRQVWEDRVAHQAAEDAARRAGWRK